MLSLPESYENLKCEFVAEKKMSGPQELKRKIMDEIDTRRQTMATESNALLAHRELIRNLKDSEINNKKS